MGASASRLQQMEALVHSLQGANAQLERQLLVVGKESDATKRAELLTTVQAENDKIRQENEMHQRQLTEELQRLRRVQIAASPVSDAGAEVVQRTATANQNASKREEQFVNSTRLMLSCGRPAQQLDSPEAEKLRLDAQTRVEELERELQTAREAAAAARQECALMLGRIDALLTSEQALRHTAALSESQAKERAVTELQQTLERADARAARDRAEWLQGAERLLRDRGVTSNCRIAPCTASVAREQADAPGGVPTSVSASDADADAAAACVTCGAGEEGSPSPAVAQHSSRATVFCANGHANQCETCWEREVRAMCASLVRGEGSSKVDASNEQQQQAAAKNPVDALMLALPPPTVVPEGDSSNLPAEEIAEAKSSASPSSPNDGSSSSNSSGGRNQPHAHAHAHADPAQLTRRTCPCCEEPYRHDGQGFSDMVPRLLQCAHTLCTACARRDAEQARLVKQLFLSCHVCREPTMLSEVADELPEAVAVSELVRQLGSQTSTGATLCEECLEQEATVHCDKCTDAGPVCEACFVALHPARSKAKKDHVPTSFTAPTVPLCAAHKKPLEHFCSHQLCWTALCDTCRTSHGNPSDAIVHAVVPLAQFATQFLQQLEKAGHLVVASSGVDALVGMARAWLDQARQAQLQARTTQELTSQQVIQLTQVLHLKTQSHIQRGVHRRVAVAQQLSRLAALHDAMKETMRGAPLAMLRGMPGLLNQLLEIKDTPAKEQLDFAALNLNLFTSFLTAIPVQTAAIVARVNELAEAPLADVTGRFVRKLGAHGAGDGQMSSPCGVAVSDGLVYVTDLSNHRVQVFNATNGSFVCKWGIQGAGDGQMSSPSGVAVSGGLVYVADLNNHRVQVFNVADGSFVRKWGTEGSGDGQMKRPFGVAVSGGLVYVADGDNRAQVFRC